MKVSKFIKNKKVQAIGVLGLCAIIATGISVHMMIKNKNTDNEINKKITAEKKNKEENNKDDENKAKKQLESIKNVDISKLPEEYRKTIEGEIKAIEDKINKKEYSEIEGEVEKLKNNIDNKLKEVVKVEEKVKEENTEKEVASGSTESNSTEKIQDENISSNNTNNNEVVTEKPQLTITENKTEVSEPKNDEAVTTIPEITATPMPQPEIKSEAKPVEQPKPVYPSLGEVKQRLINYGQSLGLTHDPSLVTNGWSLIDIQQMWSSEAGNSADQQTLFNSVVHKGFNSFEVVVKDLGDYCHMEIYVPW